MAVGIVTVIFLRAQVTHELHASKTSSFHWTENAGKVVTFELHIVRMDEHKILHINSSMLFTYIEITIYFFLLTSTLPQFHCQPPQSVYDYSTCKGQPYNCGPLQDIFYPFWGNNRPSYCGGGNLFKLNCHRDQNTTTILIGTQNFIVLGIDTTYYTMGMKRTDLDRDVCSPQFNDTYLSPTLFRYVPSVRNITIFYNCSPKDMIPNSMCGPQNPAICHVGNEDYLFDLEEFPQFKRCQRRIQVPAGFPLERYYAGNGIINHDDLEQGLKQGFQVNYTVDEECVRCLGSEGYCWDTIDRDDIEKHVRSSCNYSYCPDGSIVPATHCSVLNASHKSGSQFNWKRKLVIGVGSAVTAALLMCIIICCFRSKMPIRQVKFWLTTKNDKDIEAFLKNHEALSQKRYSFLEVKKMTNSFNVKLGQGGFGAVYKGKLFNGCPVAVKIIKASKGNGEEFINEVGSISRTSHVNVVALLGFCFEGRKKALIYEFMPNGSLDKFIYNKGLETIASLGWEDLYQIAKGIARGLEYLHRGCTTRILHFDIKPHNILLDENLCPKISDFGLAKLCHKKESIISMSDARGTMGYVAPEVCNRHFGGVSHKSDVYSYGMMLLEMVGGRKNINAEASHTSEIFFPHWVYTRLQLGSDPRPDGLTVTDTEEYEIAWRMTIVGLWCIQTFPNDRPTMSRVIEMLEGSMNSLEIPPKPLLSSPTRLESESST